MGDYFWMGQSLILPSLDREEKLIFVPMLGMRRMEKKRLRTSTRRHSNIFYTSEQRSIKKKAQKEILDIQVFSTSCALHKN